LAKLAILQKLAPEGGAGKVKNITTGLRVAGSGVGFEAIASFIDGTFLGGTFQRFGFVIPFLGIRMSAIDIANYLAHNGGSFMPKSSRPFIAVGAAKLLQGAITLGRFNPLAATSTATSPTSSSGPSGGGV